MGIPPRLLRLKLTLFLAALTGLILVPAAVAGACSLPTSPVQGGAVNDGVNPADEVVYEGTLTDAVNQDYMQIPFDVAIGTKGMRIRYCYSKLVGSDVTPTLDLGVYGPKTPEIPNWTMDELRGWSGSATRMIGIGENGFSNEATYGLDRKAYVPGRTSRGYRPGPIPDGIWAVEFGGGWIPPGGIEWKLGITPSTNTSWSNDPFQPEPWQPRIANPKPGWYQGDVHVHGEQEPGNALMKESLDLAFAPIVPGQPKLGAGLDFVDMVDHNNDVSRQLLGAERYQYPGKLVIPGSEITTYNGHINSQGASRMADFRTNPIRRFPKPSGPGPFTLDQGDLTDVPNANEPSSIFPEIDRLGGWGQQNHPETFRSAPASCRGCGWTFTDQQTGYGDIDAMEVANGIADLNHGAPDTTPVPNPFTPLAIRFYEERLAAGDHIAAVGSSDDHRAGAGYGIGTDPVIGQGATAVYAKQLSPSGIRDAVRAGQTYAKVFGADTPDVLMTAATPEGYRAIAGHSVKGRELRLSFRVKGAATNPRPGDWKLTVIRDGVPAKTFDVTGNDFTASYVGDRTARYGFQLSRKYGPSPLAMITEAYSTPIWFTQGRSASPAPKLGRLKLNQKNGTATVRVTTIGAGLVTLKQGGVKKTSARSTARRKTVTLKLAPTRKVKKQLKRRGSAKVRLAVSFTSEWTESRTTRKTVVFKQKVRKAKRHKKRR
ncbi:MAG: CehA/McbA family metallohydrolase [Solirubrobacterales bacterium]|nr:CehA/McbA family metallohydrolase [Solirubrobacterales bacterium]